MYSLKGFIVIPSFINNTPTSTIDGVSGISPIGEISTWALTFSRDKGEYKNALFQDVSLIAMSSKDSTYGKVECPLIYSSQTLKLSQWIFSYATKPGAFFDQQTLFNDLFAAFDQEIDALKVGDLITASILGTNVTFPQWVSWIHQPSGNTIKIWFNDDAFTDQYDEFEIVVIPPIDVTKLDDFFLTPNLISKEVASISTPLMMENIQAAKDKNPETLIKTETYDYNNIVYPGVTFKSNWSFLIYGSAGDNVDIIKDVLIAYILNNSTHTQEQWAAILPDIFKRTEFTIVPQWNKYSIPNKTIQPGLYSPIVNHKTALALFNNLVPDYPIDHVTDNLCSLNHPYKSISLLFVGGVNNKDNKSLITDYFPDYIDVGTGSLDYNRMEVTTKDFSLLMEYLLIVAENLTEFNSVPRIALSGFTNYTPIIHKVKRNNNFYAAAVYNGVQYLVITKSSIGNLT